MVLSLKTSVFWKCKCVPLYACEGMLHTRVRARVSAYQCLCVRECIWRAETAHMPCLSQLLFYLFTYLFTYFDIKFLTALTAHRL